MRSVFLSGIFLLSFVGVAAAQQNEIRTLIDQYSLARENSDTNLLKSILTPDVDQLVSSGEWRRGIRAAVDGMLKSSASNAGKRLLTIDNIQLLAPAAAVVDCRYEIVQADGNVRKMWSTFIVVADKRIWKIRSIRNMLPGL